jgi:PAS domain S-box-containing protein
VETLERKIARLKEQLAAVREGQERYRRLFDSLPVSVYVVDKDGIITDVNPYHVQHMGRGKLRREDYVGKSAPERESFVAAGVTEDIRRVLKGIPMTAEAVHFPKVSGGGEGYFTTRGVPVKRGKKVVGAVFITEDVTMLKMAQAELSLHKERLEELVQARTAELQDALSRVKTLSGFLPICASCKKVRNDEGYWTQVEEYLRDHSEIEFSHGLCPDCMKKLYPQLAKPDG